MNNRLKKSENKGNVRQNGVHHPFGLSPGLTEKLNQAVTQHRQNHFDSAAQIYQSILSAKPEHFDTLQLYATVLAQTGRLDQALTVFTKACEVAVSQRIEGAKLVGIYNNLGNIYKGQGQLDLALSSYTKSLDLNHNYAEAHNNIGLILFEQFRFEEAVISYERALQLNPKFLQAFNNKGSALRELGNYSQALKSFEQALELNPEYAQAHSNKGLVLQDLQNWEAALNAYQTALKYKPDYAEALNNCANVYKELGQTQKAKQFYLDALALRNDYPDALCNLGALYREDQQISDAMQCYTRALELNPSFAQAFYNRGNLFKDLRDFGRAMTDFHRAVRLMPNFAEANLNIAIVSLTLGNMAPGWLGFEWRWRSKELKQSGVNAYAEHPLWLGEGSLVNKTILLHAEQGLGDTVQFCRYAKLIKALGARVILVVPNELFELLIGLEGVDQLFRKGGSPPHFDYQCPLMSLPLAFNTQLKNIPSPNAYIQCDPAKASFWSNWLSTHQYQKTNKAKVGLAWSGNPLHHNDRNRSLSLSQLHELAQLDLDFISLQKNMSQTDKETLVTFSSVRDVSAALHDFSDTAALVECLDLVVTVDTSVAHLAAAMGKPVWVLLPLNSDWRWLDQTSTTPWYSCMRLYRQSTHRDWRSVLEQVRFDLCSKFNLKLTH